MSRLRQRRSPIVSSAAIWIFLGKSAGLRFRMREYSLLYGNGADSPNSRLTLNTESQYCFNLTNTNDQLLWLPVDDWF